MDDQGRLELENRYVQFVHYVLWHLVFYGKENELLAMKFNVALWFLDVGSFGEEYQSVTGEKFYVKGKNYPFAPNLIHICRVLEKRGILEINSHVRNDLINITSVRLVDVDKSYDVSIFSLPFLRKVRRFCNQIAFLDQDRMKENFDDHIYSNYKVGEVVPLCAYLLPEDKVLDQKDINWAIKCYDEYCGK